MGKAMGRRWCARVDSGDVVDALAITSSAIITANADSKQLALESQPASDSNG